jgi:hypothetical protein
VELQPSTGECLNFSPADYGFYLDSCVQGDHNELFWLDPSDSNGDYWYINVAASEANNKNYFMTALTFTDGSDVVALPAGYGDFALWFHPA